MYRVCFGNGQVWPSYFESSREVRLKIRLNLVGPKTYTIHVCTFSMYVNMVELFWCVTKRNIPIWDLVATSLAVYFYKKHEGPRYQSIDTYRLGKTPTGAQTEMADKFPETPFQNFFSSFQSRESLVKG